MEQVIITGAANGIGKATAQACRATGYKVIACDRDEAGLGALKKELGEGVDTRTVDVSDAAAVEALFKSFDAANSPTRLVNNAGIYPGKMLVEYTPEEIAQVYAVNVFGPMYFTKYFARPLMTAKKQGAIVNIASVAEYGALDAVYGSSKGAVAALTRCTALTLSPYIRVNAVAPGIVDTDIMKKIPPQVLQAARHGELVKEPLQPQDIAATIVFLLSDNARHYSGATLDLNNGVHRR